MEVLLPGHEGHVGAAAIDNRLFVEALLYRYCAGDPWRDLLERFGDLNNDLSPILALMLRETSMIAVPRTPWEHGSVATQSPSNEHATRSGKDAGRSTNRRVNHKVRVITLFS